MTINLHEDLDNHFITRTKC